MKKACNQEVEKRCGFFVVVKNLLFPLPCCVNATAEGSGLLNLISRLPREPLPEVRFITCLSMIKARISLTTIFPIGHSGMTQIKVYWFLPVLLSHNYCLTVMFFLVFH